MRERMSTTTSIAPTDEWTTSSYSVSGQNCVQVITGTTVRVRDSKDPGRGTIRVTARPWLMFLSGHSNEFDNFLAADEHDCGT